MLLHHTLNYFRLYRTADLARYRPQSGLLQSQSETILERASTSCLKCDVTFESPVSPPTSPVMLSTFSKVFVSVCTLFRRAKTFSSVRICTKVALLLAKIIVKSARRARSEVKFDYCNNHLTRTSSPEYQVDPKFETQAAVEAHCIRWSEWTFVKIHLTAALMGTRPVQQNLDIDDTARWVASSALKGLLMQRRRQYFWSMELDGSNVAPG